MRALSMLCLVMLAACAGAPDAGKAKKAEDPFYLKPTVFEKLPGWDSDSQSAALVPMQKSCARILKKDAAKSFGPTDIAGSYADWQAVCEKLPVDADDGTARAYFADNFMPYEIWDAQDRDGLFTGYYEPILHGSLKKKKPYVIPLYERPDDMVTVNLGDFKPELKGETVTGRVDGEKLVPYYTRADIEKGALKKQDKVVWVNSAVDAFFLHIQGSGQVQMENGDVLRVGYAAQNGRAYTAIGKSLLDKGELHPGNVSMQSIRAWLETHPDKAADVMNINESYVFFRKLDGDGPLGAEGVALTPKRSMAVDRKKFPYGAPIFIDAAAPEGEGRLQQLMVAQDTGGAIRGAVRGDFFWGAGDDAAHNAGVMKSKGQAYILLPKSVAVPAKYAPRPWWMKAGGAAGGFVYNN